jgi:hypothetical protein
MTDPRRPVRQPFRRDGLHSSEPGSAEGNYFNEVLTDVNTWLMLLPRPLRAATIARAMPAVMRPYSIAVAPDSSDKKFKKIRFNGASLGTRFSGVIRFHPRRFRPTRLKLRKPKLVKLEANRFQLFRLFGTIRRRFCLHRPATFTPVAESKAKRPDYSARKSPLFHRR